MKWCTGTTWCSFDGEENVVGEGPDGGSALPLWHVTIVMSGAAVDTEQLRAGLEQLVQQRPFMLSVRYAADRAELVYWDEGESLDDVAALALRLWGDHRESAGLPPWAVGALEVLDRATLIRRGELRGLPPLVLTGVSPL